MFYIYLTNTNNKIFKSSINLITISASGNAYKTYNIRSNDRFWSKKLQTRDNRYYFEEDLSNFIYKIYYGRFHDF